jgi:nitric oxide reductase activation protein
VDESPYYDQELINHLVAQLRRVKRGWREVHSSSGELDVESYVSRQPKAFIDEEQVKVGGFRVMLLLDHSGSIDYYEAEYKRACIALCECLEELGIPFAAYAFSAPDGRHTNVYLVKSFQERWTRMNAKRLAQIPARGGTPLAEVYDVLRPQVERNKGGLHFITLTDGVPSHFELTRMRVRSLRRHCRMIGVAVGRSMDEAVALAENLGSLGYDRYVALDNVRKLPEKILGLLGR